MSEKLVFFYTQAKNKRWSNMKIHRIFTLICTMYVVTYVWRYSIETSLTADCYHFHTTTKKLWPYFFHSLYIHSTPFHSILFHFSSKNFQIIHADAVIIDGFHVSEVYNFCIIYLVLHNLMGTYIQFFFFCLSRHHIGYLKIFTLHIFRNKWHSCSYLLNCNDLM